MEIVVQLLTAFGGSLGFALLFGLRRRYLFAASLGGLLAWGVYLAADALLHVSFLSYLLSAVFAVVYAELLARWRKTPATLFVIPAILPLVPGGALYEAMRCAVRGELAEARHFGAQALTCALALAAGISFVTVCRKLRTRREG